MAHLFESPIDIPASSRIGSVTSGSKRKRETSLDSDASNEAEEPALDDAEADDVQPELPVDFPHAPLSPEASGRVITNHRNLKHQHLHVLNAILHRCLLDHDYRRTSKAFAMLLRFEITGRRMDLRKKGLWGIGAELMLRRQHVHDDNDQDSDTPNHTIERQSSSQAFTEEGFEAAKEYYQRLILQYPYKKQRPHDMNAQSFYPAMFTLWIFQVQSRRQLDERSGGMDNASSPLPSEDISTASPEQGIDLNDGSEISRPRRQELNEAREILNIMGELTTSPPYDRDPVLLKLEARVQYWIADLLKMTSPVDSAETADSHMQKARHLFERARGLGAHLEQDEVQFVEESTRESSLTDDEADDA